MALDATRIALPLQPEGAQDPTEAETKVAAEVNEKYTRWRQLRMPHEVTWFLNAAYLRGLQWVVWNETRRQLEAPPSKRIRLTINYILPKAKARQQKFLKRRFEPTVLPFTTDRKDRLDARATKRAFEYHHQKEGLERKYRHALNWATVASKGYLWVYWDPTRPALQQTVDPLTGQPSTQTVQAGDVCVEPGSPFEVLVPDPGLSFIGDQPEIMRVKARLLSDVKQRYPGKADKVQADLTSGDLFHYQRQISTISPQGSGSAGDPFATSGDKDAHLQYVLVKELFTRACATYPRGRHVVVAGDVTLRLQEELPNGFSDYVANPYPCVEFPDTEAAGQFWPTTMVEQLIGLNKELNLLRSKVSEQARLAAFPKLLAPEQCQLSAKAWTSDPGEVVRYVALPGVPEPRVLAPANVAADLWRILEKIPDEIDTVSGIHRVSQGDVANTNSGFQVNLLQEAVDAIHGPDVRLHELAWEELCWKIRRMMKRGYTADRLISIMGRNYAPEVLQFSQANIDENAEIRIVSDSALSSSPSVRSKQVLELHAAGVLGDPAAPETGREVTRLLNLGGVGEFREQDKVDAELAERENKLLEQGIPFEQVVPAPWENHDIHWEEHTRLFKLPEFEDWTPETKREAFKHAVYHAKYINPQHAFNLAMELQLEELYPLLMPQEPAAPAAAPPAAPPPPPESAPQAPPPPPAA